MQHSDGSYVLFDGTAALKPREPRKLALVTQKQLLHVVDDEAVAAHGGVLSNGTPVVRRPGFSAQGTLSSEGAQQSRWFAVPHSTYEPSRLPDYARRRILVALLAFVLAFGIVVMVGSAVREAYVGGKLSESRTEYVTVQPGDSLWGIAQRSQVSGVSTGEVVSWISSKNGLSGNDLKPGQEILVPVVG